MSSPKHDHSNQSLEFLRQQKGGAGEAISMQRRSTIDAARTCLTHAVEQMGIDIAPVIDLTDYMRPKAEAVAQPEPATVTDLNTYREQTASAPSEEQTQGSGMDLDAIRSRIDAESTETPRTYDGQDLAA
jgi:hypothetical protein